MNADEDPVDRDCGCSEHEQQAEAAMEDEHSERDGEGDAGMVAGERVVGGVMNEQQGRAGMIHERPIVEPEVTEEDIDEQRECGRGGSGESGQLRAWRTAWAGHEPDRTANGDEDEDGPRVVELRNVLGAVVMPESAVQRVEQRPIHQASNGNELVTTPRRLVGAGCHEESVGTPKGYAWLHGCHGAQACLVSERGDTQALTASAQCPSRR